MYGFFRTEENQAPPGLREADISRISIRMALLTRQDGFNRGEIPSAWFLFQKKIFPKESSALPAGQG
jgi:hypothetical protein